jgi:hypothetical protein
MTSRMVVSCVFFLILVTLHTTVHGEFVVAIGASATVVGNEAHISGTQSLYRERYIVQGSADGSVQNPGLEIGVTYWFAKVPVLGVGLDYFDSSVTFVTFGDARMTITALSPCLLLRIPLGKSRAFEHGRIFPYIGIGLAIELLDGPVNLFFEETERSLESVGFLGKIGLEFVIVGGWSAFVEARYMTCAFTDDSVDAEYWGLYWFIPVVLGRDTTHLEANITQGQITIGIALHLGK